ncbi:uncharacterized protein BHQ10_009904 [Talaromyces amestolkiae]|uniref:Major facilitator superfamily (MFS) profile domain-containing protein n=1 Tax=Talaromyces amestolkiae TaxID=1196081 RepID=A0A364LDM4_TALAM|nr:uncharacterized protein BHQ10_009904 [Talaromyces amestolkiae]RAO73892.1 hypothetical protein BHQ10_009904 [Talaromyces amestolkiae]
MDSTALTMADVLASRNTGWFANTGIIKLNAILCLSLVSSYATGYDGSMMNGLQSLDEWNAYFHNPTANTLALLNAIQNVGQLAAIPFCAYACDTFGRKRILVASSFVLLIGVCLQAAAQNNGMFIAARGILGIGLAFNITAAPLLIMELAFPSQQCVQRVVELRINRSFMDYSPRWLIAKDREEEAQAIITKYHANGNPHDPIVAVEMHEIREALRIEQEFAQNNSYLAFFKTKGNRTRFWLILCVGFFSQWSGNGVISYYLTLVLDSIGYKDESTQTLINGVLAIWSLISTTIVSLFVEKFSRRFLFLASTAGMLVSYIVWTALEAEYEKQIDAGEDGSPAYARGVLAMIILFNTAMAVGWGPLQVTYVVEILPYNLRARGLVLYNLFVAMALIFNQYANPIALTNIKWRYYIVYDVWLLFELIVVYFLWVETRGPSLEEIAAILDGQEVKEKLIETAADAASRDIGHFNDVDNEVKGGRARVIQSA